MNPKAFVNVIGSIYRIKTRQVFFLKLLKRKYSGGPECQIFVKLKYSCLKLLKNGHSPMDYHFQQFIHSTKVV